MPQTSDKVLAMHARALERFLKRQDVPVAARDVGETLGLAGDVQSVRRFVREIVKHARQTCGVRVCADFEGYWLARGPDEWAGYLAAKAADARFKFVGIKRAKEAVVARMNDQPTLFEQDVLGTRETCFD